MGNPMDMLPVPWISPLVLCAWVCLALQDRERPCKGRRFTSERWVVGGSTGKGAWPTSGHGTRHTFYLRKAEPGITRRRLSCPFGGHCSRWIVLLPRIRPAPPRTRRPLLSNPFPCLHLTPWEDTPTPLSTDGRFSLPTFPRIALYTLKTQYLQPKRHSLRLTPMPLIPPYRRG